MDQGRARFVIALVAMFTVTVRCDQVSSVSAAGDGSSNRSDDAVPEAGLQRHLFRSYYVEARPVFDPAKPVEVGVQFAIQHIVDFDEDTNVVTMVGFLTQTWTDKQLVWEPSKYMNITRITRMKSDIWIPDIMLENAIAPSVLLREAKALIMSDGKMTLVEPRRYQVHCQLSSPDRATCVLVFGSWTGNTATIALSVPFEQVDASNYEQHRTWELLKTKATRHTNAYACCPGENFDSVRFSVSLKRRRDLHADSDANKDSGVATSRGSLAVFTAVVVAILTAL